MIQLVSSSLTNRAVPWTNSLPLFFSISRLALVDCFPSPTAVRSPNTTLATFVKPLYGKN
jgi:hypothetical protein